jgi:hypothetical protein
VMTVDKWVLFDTSTGGLLFPEGIIRPVVSVSITQSIHLLVDYYSPREMYRLSDRNTDYWEHDTLGE